MPMVSVVLPCYNHEKYVGESIQSVLKQTYADFELFVFDNGSEDNSWEVIQAFDDPRMIKIHLEDNDLLEVKKQFIQKASGKYMAIMYSDDIWLETKLEKQVMLLETTPDAKICFTWSKYVGENLEDISYRKDFFYEYNKTQKEWWAAFMDHNNHLSCPSLVCEKDIYEKYFGKLYPYRQIADYYCWMKMLEDYNLYMVEEILVNQRMHSEEGSQNESYPTTENVLRELIEKRYIFYHVIDEMKDSVFIDNFKDYLVDKNVYKHIDVLCEKFLFLCSRVNIWEEADNVISFYCNYFHYEEEGIIFYERLRDKYGFSRKDYFELTGKIAMKDQIDKYRNARWVQMENADFSTIKYPDKLTIYGAANLGKALYRRIASYCIVEQFIDRCPQAETYKGIPIRSIENAKLDSETYIIVTPAYDYDKILLMLQEKYEGIKADNVIGLDKFLDKAMLLDDSI